MVAAHFLLDMSSKHQPLKALSLLFLLGLANVARAWTDMEAKMVLEARAALGGTACTLAAKYGYVR